MARFKPLETLSVGLALALSGWCQSNAVGQNPTGPPQVEKATTQSKQEQKQQPGAAREIGAGAGTVGGGAAKGAGAVAKGTGKGAVDLVTLHPINAGASIGKGAANAGKDVTVGTVKGTGKVTKGIGRAIKHLF